jgi:predicted enzyme related to lactoylglutathione lyase
MTITITGVTFDCADPDRVAAFWADALSWEKHGHFVVPPDGGPGMEFMHVPEEKTVKNRMHIDLYTDDLDVEIERLKGLGATVAWEERFPKDWPFRNVVLQDVEGNEFCLGNGDPDEVKRLLGL